MPTLKLYFCRMSLADLTAQPWEFVNWSSCSQSMKTVVHMSKTVCWNNFVNSWKFTKFVKLKTCKCLGMNYFQLVQHKPICSYCCLQACRLSWIYYDFSTSHMVWWPHKLISWIVHFATIKWCEWCWFLASRHKNCGVETWLLVQKGRYWILITVEEGYFMKLNCIIINKLCKWTPS